LEIQKIVNGYSDGAQKVEKAFDVKTPVLDQIEYGFTYPIRLMVNFKSCSDVCGKESFDSSRSTEKWE